MRVAIYILFRLILHRWTNDGIPPHQQLQMLLERVEDITATFDGIPSYQQLQMLLDTIIIEMFQQAGEDGTIAPEEQWLLDKIIERWLDRWGEDGMITSEERLLLEELSQMLQQLGNDEMISWEEQQLIDKLIEGLKRWGEEGIIAPDDLQRLLDALKIEFPAAESNPDPKITLDANPQPDVGIVPTAADFPSNTPLTLEPIEPIAPAIDGDFNRVSIETGNLGSIIETDGWGITEVIDSIINCLY